MAEIYISLPKFQQNEGTTFSATAYFRDGTAASAPTTAKYRIDCLTTKQTIRDWTSLTPATSISITIDSNDNAIKDSSNRREKKQIIVNANAGTTQYQEIATWHVYNIPQV